MTAGEISDDNQALHSEAFTVWVNEHPQGPGQLRARGAVLKTGHQVAKTVTYSTFGDRATGEVKKRELRFGTVPRHRHGPGYDFANRDVTWYCENGEIDRLVTFLGTRCTARAGTGWSTAPARRRR